MASEKIKIIRGADKAFNIALKKGDNPKDLTGFVTDAITAKFTGEAATIVLTLDANANGSVIQIINECGGQIKIKLSDADTLLMKVADRQDFEITTKEGAGPDFDIDKSQILGFINVVETLFP